jgi:Domain of unknown function (DUF4382)
MRYSALTTGIVTLAAGLLAGCSSRTDVSLTGNTPAQYSHVYITTQEVWFNTSATAGPDDAGWTKFPLTTPTTVDLVQDTAGSLGEIATSLRQLPGTYSQIRLIPVTAVDLATSASDIGAIYNAEADYTDSKGVLHQLPLELLNPDKGIGIAGSLHIAVGSFGATAALSSGLGTASTTSTTASTDTTTGTSSATTGTTSTTTTTTFALSIDGGRDLVPFTFGPLAASADGTGPAPVYGVILSSHAGAFNLENVGGISGTLTLTNFASYTSGIQATAETLSADGSRHMAVLSTPVRSDGSFLLYPLPSSTSTAATYDVVIHGAGIATIILKAVTIPLATSTTDSTSTTSATTGSTTVVATNTTTVAPTTTAPTTNIVSVGAIVPRAATTYAPAITTSASTPLAADAQVGFYQSLGGSNEVPYQIEASPIDPFNQVLANPLQLSLGTIDSGTFVSSGTTIALFSSAPLPLTGQYFVAATAPSFADGPLTPTVTAAVPSVTLAALAVSSGATLASLKAAILPVSPGTYTDGELLVSHNGTLVSQVPLTTSLLANGGAVSASVPSGTSAAKYYVSVRVWNAAVLATDPTQLVRQWYPTLVDMSGGGNGSISFSIN